ncbi:MAG TPA: 3-hydroxyacyl-CoA dehydrogenase family protein [Firmicutes bacterium]|nr:3-hydroxyacyl-CoA dehydrogenase family protein [Candidatus Fermentithermobacillaceae bacterium]
MKAGVIGAGTMGRGIAEVLLASGFEVVLVDRSPELAEKGRESIRKSLQRGVDKGRIAETKMDEMLGKLKVGADFTAVADASVALEAVYENMEVKRAVLDAVSSVVSSTALIGSNTSSLSVTGMSSSVKNPGRFLGVHFFNPVPVMKLVEIIPGEKTLPEYVEKARDLAVQMGKTPVVVKESPGFIVNRLLCPLMNEAAYLVSEGVASPEDIDTAMKLGANHPIGPLALADLVGIDVLYAIMETLHEELGGEANPDLAAKYRPCPLLKEMMDRGELGRKTGRGFFSY